jgi:hypothetical protein
MQALESGVDLGVGEIDGPRLPSASPGEHRAACVGARFASSPNVASKVRNRSCRAATAAADDA